MKVFRFMSYYEFEQYRSGKTLINKKDHHKETKRKTNSIGFCFLDTNDYIPEKALHFLSGIVNFDICAVFETNARLNKSWGTYAKPLKSSGNILADLLRIMEGMNEQFTSTEYCTTQYSNKDFKLIKYSQNIWQQWNPQSKQSKLNWKKV